jgi:ATP-dependent Lon protease
MTLDSFADEAFESIPADPKLDEKIQRVFGTLAIDKRRLPMSQLQKRGVPAYVGEWLLDSIVPGTGPLKPEEAAKLQQWANRYIPGSGDANLIKNRLLNGEIVKVLTPVQVDVELTRRRRERVAKMSLLGISDAFISDGIVESYPDLLNQGMWGVVEIANTKEGVALNSFRPMQATVNLELYKEARREFTLQEWRALILASMGYNAEVFSETEQMLLVCRLLPLVQKNMHMMELAPKGTGKSYIYENISPRVRLISGGNVSPAVLFVNNMTNQWGLLARYSVLVLDEVQTLKFEKPEEIIGGLKGFLANGRLTRGGLHETASDCGLVLLANITLDAQQRPVMDPLVRELPGFLQETAFLDRLRALIPGWEIRKLSSECFARSVGLKSDFSVTHYWPCAMI